MAKLDLSSFELLFQSGENFSITENQYQQETGQNFPQCPYLERNSALARMARSYGYEVKLQNVIVLCERRAH